MTEVEIGQFVVARGRYGYTVARADQVTAKQIRTRRGGSYHQLPRADVLFAGSANKAELVIEALEAAQRDRRNAWREADAAFTIATAPAVKIRDDAKEAANIAERGAVLRIIEAAK